MTDLHPGDTGLLRHEDGVSVVAFKVAPVHYAGHVWLESPLASLYRTTSQLAEHGWSVDEASVVRKPEPLPTEPGTVWRDESGWPWVVSDQGKLSPLGAGRYARGNGEKLTRLDTRAYWQAEIVEEIAAWVSRSHPQLGRLINEHFASKENGDADVAP